MQDNLQNKYIELRVNRDFGDLITVYFDFLKQNLKKFTNVFLSYNGIFLIGLLLVSYLLVSGFVGLFAEGADSFFDGDSSGKANYFILIGIGAFLFFVIFIVVALLNYSLAAGYLISYEENEGNSFDKKEVWEFFKQRLGSIVIFVVLLILIFVGYTVVSLMVMIIPFLGIFVNYTLQFFIMAWFGVSFFCMLRENKGVTEALGEGWNLVIKSFWRAVGVNFILGLLNWLLFFIVMMVPGIILGIYTYHIVQNEASNFASIVPTIIYTIGTCTVLIMYIYVQSLSQFVNGMLYYALHEKMYNTHTRSKIEQIGNLDQ